MISRTAVSVLAALCVGVSGAASSKIPVYITAAVADPNRPEADIKRDAGRKPAEVIAFAGVKPGDRCSSWILGRSISRGSCRT